ncbi:MAG: DUF2059 domain-containing protein [Erythrobacter sp.]|uniref:DUF2059 domain-containing protein n=1 Tax=Erythrobacter sp. TaxID=1042 RepID=UPI003264BCB0
MKYALSVMMGGAIIGAAMATTSVSAAEPSSQIAGAQAETTDEAKLALAQAILEQAYPGDSHIKLFQDTAEQMEAQVAQSLDGLVTDEGALAILVQWQELASVETNEILLRNIPMLMDAWAIAFADLYSTQELQDILAFVSTPSGQAFMGRQAELISHPAFSDANQTYMAEIMQVVTNKMPELVEELMQYEAAKQSPTE